MYQILQMLSLVARVNDAFDLVFLVAILCDSDRARYSYRLSWEAFAIGFDVGDVDDRVNAHGAGKTELYGVSPDQLRDGIGTEPSFRQLPRGSRKTEVICGEPDLVSDSICRSV